MYKEVYCARNDKLFGEVQFTQQHAGYDYFYWQDENKKLLQEIMRENWKFFKVKNTE